LSPAKQLRNKLRFPKLGFASLEFPKLDLFIAAANAAAKQDAAVLAKQRLLIIISKQNKILR